MCLIEAHKLRCEYAMVECGNAGCGAKMRRREVAAHLNVQCPEQLMDCPWARFGCKTPVRMRKHTHTNMHTHTHTSTRTQAHAHKHAYTYIHTPFKQIQALKKSRQCDWCRIQTIPSQITTAI